MVSLVLTLIGPDRPGLIESLAEVAAQHNANWLESRMARLAGKFAGVLRVSASEAQASALIQAFQGLEAEGLKIVIERSNEDTELDVRHVDLDIIGPDRPGIIREISHALAARGVNIDDLTTECSSATMSGEMLLRATAQLRVPLESRIDDLRHDLEEIANELTLDLRLEES